MATVSLTPTPYFQGLDANGNPINGGKLFAYQAGTTIKQDTYTTAAGSTPNANPVILDSAGRASVFLDVSLSYKLVLAPANDTDPPVSPIWTQDNITAVPTSMTVIPTGLVVGFSGSVVNDVIQLGDADFRLDFDSGTAPRLQYATGDLHSYNRASNFFEWDIAATLVAKLSASGLEIASGLIVGFAGTPTADAVKVGDANFYLDFAGGGAGVPALYFDGDDRIQYNRSTKTYQFIIDASSEVTFDQSGVQVLNGLVVGFAGTPGDDEIRLGDANFKMSAASAAFPTLLFDTNDFEQYDRSANAYTWSIGSTVALLNATGFIASGLTVGATSVSQVAGALVMKEIAAPGNPAADEATVFLQDNGAGKTQLMVKFNTGAAIQIAIQV